MARDAPVFLKPASAFRLFAVIALTTVIFVADTITDLQIAVAVFYIAVVLLAIGFLRTRGVILVSAGCMALTLLSYVLTTKGSAESGLINCVISLSAIGVTAYLALKTTSAALVIHESQAQLTRVARVVTLGELTASIAHEVNQPLAAVVTSGNACLRWLALEPPNLEKAGQAVERMIKDANRASDVIARVRSLVKQTPPHKDWLNVADVVTEIIALTRGEIDKNHIVLRTVIGDDVPPILADRVQLQQVLLNLILNAIDAMSTVAARARELVISVEVDGPNAVRFEVRDSGVGLEPEKLDRTFDAFYTTKKDGMGIGLTISRSIIEAHGGRVRAMSNPDGGAVFQFTLPTSAAQAE